MSGQTRPTSDKDLDAEFEDKESFLEVYSEEEDPNRRYHLLLQEMKRCRREGKDTKQNDFNSREFRQLLRELNEKVDGTLLVFAANDFGRPYAFHPEDKRRALMEDVRNELLTSKYKTNPELNQIRHEILDFDPLIHKVLVVEHMGDEIYYHAPAGQEADTNFITARQYIGLIDYLLDNRWEPPQDASWDDMDRDKEDIEPDYTREIYSY